MGSETLNDLTGIWGLGLLIGMQHALEADHVAAVSSLVSRDNAALRVVSQGVAWALGHAMILILVGGGLLIFGAAIADAAALWLEATVGAMLIVLGGHVLLRLRRERVHFHRHGHADGMVHWHPHSHLGQAHPHQRSGHDHSHASQRPPLRALFVGMMQGLSGSAALILLAATTVGSAWTGLVYIVVFGIGSILGMAALSLVLAIPLSWSARALAWANRGLQGIVGTVTCALGAYVIYTNLSEIFI